MELLQYCREVIFFLSALQPAAAVTFTEITIMQKIEKTPEDVVCTTTVMLQSARCSDADRRISGEVHVRLQCRV